MLARRDPFRDMLSLRRTMDDLFDSAIVGWQGPSNWDLALDVSENEDEYTVKASIPGVKPEDLDITYNNNTLTIKGETKAEEEKEGEQFHIRERRYGSFSRSVVLPSRVNADEISADYQDGVLKVHLPKSEEAKPRRISVEGGEQKKVIEG